MYKTIWFVNTKTDAAVYKEVNAAVYKERIAIVLRFYICCRIFLAP
jgi:hypothetical protein